MEKFRKIYFVLLLICVMLIPNVVNAATKAKLVLECTESVYDEKEEGVSCFVSLEIPADETISFKSISFKVSKDMVGDVATFEAADDDIVVSGSFDNGFTLTKKNNGTFSSSDIILNIEDITMPGIEKATYEKNQYNFNMKITNGKLVVNDKDSYSVSEYTNTIRLLSTDNTLKSVTLNGTALSGFNPKATQYKYTTEEDLLKVSAVANNQNASISINDTSKVVKEIKNKQISLPYGSETVKLTVTSESGNEKVYTIHVFRPYKLFPGYDFNFDSKTNTYTLNVGSDVKNFAICSYDPEESKFVAKANTLCMKIDVIADVYGLNISDTTYYKTLKLNGVGLAAEKDSWSDKEIFDKMDIVTDKDGNQTFYDVLGTLKDGANTLKFSINTNYPAYTITINKGNSSSSNETTDNKADGEGSGGNTSTTDKTPNSGSSNATTNNNSVNKTDKDSTVKDETVESPKTGIVTYSLAILGIAGIAGGAYYFLRKKNLIKKI